MGRFLIAGLVCGLGSGSVWIIGLNTGGGCTRVDWASGCLMVLVTTVTCVGAAVVTGFVAGRVPRVRRGGAVAPEEEGVWPPAPKGPTV